MPELIRLIANRLREYMGNRRRAPRYRIKLEVDLALRGSPPTARTGAERSGQQLKLSGYTRDVSVNGLALIVPAVRIGGEYIMGSNRPLEIMLKLPTGIVTIQGTPVRYSPLDDDAKDSGYLIGVRIDRMNEVNRAKFDAYLETRKLA